MTAHDTPESVAARLTIIPYTDEEGAPDTGMAGLVMLSIGRPDAIPDHLFDRIPAAAAEVICQRDRAQTAEIARLTAELSEWRSAACYGCGCGGDHSPSEFLARWEAALGRATQAEAALAAMNPANPDWREVAMSNGRALGERNAAWDRLNAELAALQQNANREADEMTDRYQADQSALAASEKREQAMREASDLAAAIADRPKGWHWSLVQQTDDRFLASFAEPGAGWSACGTASDPVSAMRVALAHPTLTQPGAQDTTGTAGTREGGHAE